MPKLDEMPVELLAQVAYFLANKISYRINNLKELLALRCASRSCKDAVRRAARQHSSVKSLSFHGSSAQKIVESPCAQTLREVDVSYAPQFSSEDVLRLVRGCPRLADLEWETSEEHPLDHDVDGPNVDAIDAILTSRGGRTSGVRAYW